MPCPTCASTATREQPQPTALGYRTFRCTACRCRFNERTGAPFNFLEYPTDIVLLVVRWRLQDKLSLRDLAQMFLERGFVFAQRDPRHGRSQAVLGGCGGGGGPLPRADDDRRTHLCWPLGSFGNHLVPMDTSLNSW